MHVLCCTTVLRLPEAAPLPTAYSMPLQPHVAGCKPCGQSGQQGVQAHMSWGMAAGWLAATYLLHAGGEETAGCWMSALHH